MRCRRWLVMVGTAVLSAALLTPTVPATAGNAPGTSSPLVMSDAGPAAAVDPPPVTASVQLGSAVNQVAFSPDGLFAYVTGFGRTMERIRTADNSVEASIALGGSVTNSLTISPDGLFAYVGVQSGQVDVPHAIERIRLSDNSVVAHFPVPGSPGRIAIARDGSFALVMDVAAPGHLRRIRTSDGRVVADIQGPDGGPYAFADVAPRIAPDGSFAYVAAKAWDGWAALARIDLSTNTVTGYIPVAAPEPTNHFVRPNGITDLQFSPDGSFVMIVSASSASTPGPYVYGWVSRLNTGDSAPTHWTLLSSPPPLPGQPLSPGGYLSLAPDGKSAFVAEQAGVMRISTDTLTVESQFLLPPRTTLQTPRPARRAVFSPSGQFAYAMAGDDWVYRIEWPRRPGMPQAEASSTGVKVTVAPAGEGIAPDSYRVTSSPGSKVCTVAAPQVSCVVEGLTAHTAYRFSVVAVNGAGPSEPSEWSALVSAPAIPPGPPTGVSARPGDRSAQLAFTPPDYTAGLPVTAYEYSTDDGRSWTRPTSNPTATTIQIGNLTNGAAYLMRVRTVTAAGDGQPSSAAPVTPRAVPGAPRMVRATPGDARVKVMWDPPDTDGGAAVTGYRVVAAPGGATCETADTFCDVVGLTNAVAYTFSVRAVNAAGVSGSSPASAPVAPRRSTWTGKVVSWPAREDIEVFPNGEDSFAYRWVDVSRWSMSDQGARKGIALVRGAALVGEPPGCKLTSVTDNCAPPQMRSGVTEVAAGGNTWNGASHYLALKGGAVYDWSVQFEGFRMWWNAVPPQAQSGVTAIAAGSDWYGHSYSMALSRGQVVTWGITRMRVPVQAQSGVSDIAAGPETAMALKGGKVIAWDTHGAIVALPPEWQSGVSAIAAGEYGLMAIKDGRVIFSPGDEPSADILAQVQSDVTDISSGATHWLALKADGTIVGDGEDVHGREAAHPPARFQGRYLAIDAANIYSSALVAPAPPRPATLGALPAKQLAPWNANLRLRPQYVVPEDTKVTKATITAVKASNKRFVGSGPSVVLGGGRYLITQKLWYMMSNLKTGFVQRTQVVSIAKEPPPPPPGPPRPPGPPPTPTYEYLDSWGPVARSNAPGGLNDFSLPNQIIGGGSTWIAVKQQGVNLKVYVDNPQRFLGLYRTWMWTDVPRCFVGVKMGEGPRWAGDFIYNGGLRESDKEAFASRHYVHFYPNANSIAWKGTGAAPSADGAAYLRRQVDSCR